MAPALHGSGRDVEDRGGLGHGHALQIDKHNREALVVREPGERVRDLDDGLSLGDVISRLCHCGDGVGVVRNDRSDPASAQPVQARVYDYPVQPGRELGVAAKPGGLPEGRNKSILNGILCLCRIAERAQRDGPRAITMPRYENGECGRVPFDVSAQQRRIVDVVDIGREIQGLASRAAFRCGEPSAAAAR